MTDLFLDRDREVWRRVHNGDMVRLTLGGYISPPRRLAWVEQSHGPLIPLVPGGTATTPEDSTTQSGTPSMDIVRITRSKADGLYRWHRKAPNGEIISRGEEHTRWSDAQRAAERANQDAWWTLAPDSRGDYCPKEDDE